MARGVSYNKKSWARNAHCRKLRAAGMNLKTGVGRKFITKPTDIPTPL
jgi:hypothetical protein